MADGWRSSTGREITVDQAVAADGLLLALLERESKTAEGVQRKIERVVDGRHHRVIHEQANAGGRDRIRSRRIVNS